MIIYLLYFFEKSKMQFIFFNIVLIFLVSDKKYTVVNKKS